MNRDDRPQSMEWLKVDEAAIWLAGPCAETQDVNVMAHRIMLALLDGQLSEVRVPHEGELIRPEGAWVMVESTAVEDWYRSTYDPGFTAPPLAMIWGRPTSESWPC